LVLVLSRAVDQAHRGVQVAEKVIAEIEQPDMAQTRAEVKLDRLPVAGQRARLQCGPRLPPVQSAGQVLAEGGLAVVDVRALIDPAHHLQQGVGACLLGRGKGRSAGGGTGRPHRTRVARHLVTGSGVPENGQMAAAANETSVNLLNLLKTC